MKAKRKLLETFKNEFPERDYTIVHTAPEFTSLCPITVEYVPDKLCVELKSLKLYFNSYRDEGLFFESATNRILDDLVAVCKPRYMLITAEFNVRGGISSTIEVEYYSDEFNK